MSKPSRRNLKRFYVFSNLGILLLLALAICSLFWINYRHTTEEHANELYREILRSKREFIENAVNRTIQVIDLERTRCVTQTDGYCDEVVVKERLHDYIRTIRLKDNGYIWVNAVLNYEGGDNYAYRFVHPNLPDTEGSKLSTKMQDIKGNTPYLTELEGVKNNGEIFFDYWFKKMDSELIRHKMTFAKLYKPYDWIVATGVYLDDIDGLVKSRMIHWQKQFFRNAVFSLAITATASICAWLLSLVVGRRVDAMYTAEEVAVREANMRRQQETLEEQVRQRTADLADAKVRADKANQAKSVFLANMSHELRTPLNAILGFAQMMKHSRDSTAEQQDNLEIITRSGEHLLNLINNVLSISKIESGRLELETAPCDLHQLLHEVKSIMDAHASSKGLSFTLEQAPDLPRSIVTDLGKLRQVLINLIGNAVKYTDQGGVVLRAKAASQDEPEQVRLRFEVVDTGPGILQEDRQRIFAPFVQVGERPPIEAGTGLGLSICKQYVELIGGEIGVDCGPRGVGTVFFFEIPVVILPSKEIHEPSIRGRVIGVLEEVSDFRLLIAEDQPDTRLLLRKLLEPFGFSLKETVNGEEALSLWEIWRPHLIFMDIRMPVMDGLEATRRIKAADTDGQTKIVVITAHALEEEHRTIIAAGCDDFIHKPFHDWDIYDALSRNLGIRFRYDEKEAVTTARDHITAADLADLPNALLGEMEAALIGIDIDAVDWVIADIRLHNTAVAEKLAAEAQSLQYGRLLRVVRTARNNKEG